MYYREYMDKIHGADVVIIIGRDGIESIKNRHGECAKLDLAQVLQILKPYQDYAFKSLIDSWIIKFKIYRPFL